MPLLSPISSANPFRDFTGGKRMISHIITGKENPRRRIFIQYNTILFHNTVPQSFNAQQLQLRRRMKLAGGSEDETLERIHANIKRGEKKEL